MQVSVARGSDDVTAPPDGICVPGCACEDPPGSAFMSEITTVWLDLAKNVFQAHGADVSGRVLFRKKLRRDEVLSFFSQLPPFTVAMEACGGAHLGAARPTSWAMRCG